MRRVLMSGGLWLKGISVAVLAVLWLSCVVPVQAEEFTASTVGDYGNVTVMEVAGNYDKILSDGTPNDQARQAIAKEFYRTHKDTYDFLVIFTNFDVAMTDAETLGFYTSIKNDVQGIGEELFDYSSQFGSNGRLQGTVDMGNLFALATDPLDPGYEETLTTLNHELLHRWSAYLNFTVPDGTISNTLLGRDDSHWSFLLDTDGSLHYGNDWVDNGDGTFTSVARETYYSPLDLYLMGMIGKDRVPPLTLIENPAIDPARLPRIGETISGVARTVTIDDIIAAMGERLPAANDAPKRFNVAFIYITAPGSFASGDLYGIESLRNGLLTRFSILTDGQGLIRVAVEPQDGVTTNPGVEVQEVVPRTLPPDIDEGVQWLATHQETDGSWRDAPETRGRDTAETLAALKLFNAAPQGIVAGLGWLDGAANANTDYLARKLEAYRATGRDGAALVEELVNRRNSDGGWGSARGFVSNPTDSALVLKALGRNAYSNRAVIDPALNFLLNAQNADGGWGLSGSLVQPTANVVLAFSIYRNLVPLNDSLARAASWLKARQNTDGGFGNSPSTVYDSAIALAALSEIGEPSQVTAAGTAYLLATQTDNGSWYDSPYQTAAAVQALWKTTRDPDLAIATETISFIPERISALPANVVIKAEVSNLGRMDVAQTEIHLYRDHVAADTLIDSQTIAVPAQTSVQVTFGATVTDGNRHLFHVVVDPNNHVAEQNEANNKASAELRPETTLDFAVEPADLTLSAEMINIFDSLTLTVTVHNRGTIDALSVPVRIFVRDGAVEIDLSLHALDIPAGGSATDSVTWRSDRSGSALLAGVVVDPQARLAETDETNNGATRPFVVIGTDRPNLTVSHDDMTMTPFPVLEGGSATVTVVVHNNGFSAVAAVPVRLYLGVPGNGGVLLGEQEVSRLDAGAQTEVTFPWNDVAGAGTKILTVQADPGNVVVETSEMDNEAFVTATIASLPDLQTAPAAISFEPAAPREGDAVTVHVVVQNSGDQAAADVVVQLDEAGTVLGTQTIPALSGHAQATVAFDYGMVQGSGVHEVTVVLDPDNTVREFDEGNNQTRRGVGVQDSDLWISEKFISPNGDGIQDSTQFSFRLNEPANVTVEILDPKQQQIRLFSNPEFMAATSGSVVWDGRNNDGNIVDDGDYVLRVVAGSGMVLGSITVVVDNNRSPMAEAAGTDFLFQRKLPVPRIYGGNFTWLPDESGIVYLGADNTVSYYGLTAGPVSLLPESLRIAPGTFTVDANKGKYAVASDASKVLYVADAKKVSGKPYPQTSTLWMADVSGNASVISQNSVNYKYYNYTYVGGDIKRIAISPDNTKVIYLQLKNKSCSSNTCPYYDITVSDLISGMSTIIAEVYSDAEFIWSPDSDKFAYKNSNSTEWKVVEFPNSGDIYNSEIRTHSQHQSSWNDPDPVWLDNNRILFHTDNGISVVNDNDGAVFEYSYDTRMTDVNTRISRDRKWLVTQGGFDGYHTMFYVLDIYEFNNVYKYTSDTFWIESSNDILYSKNINTTEDGSKLFYIGNNDNHEFSADYFNFNKNSYNRTVIHNNFRRMYDEGSCFVDDETIFVNMYLSQNEYLPIFLNLDTGEKSAPIQLRDNYEYAETSPRGTYLTLNGPSSFTLLGSLLNLTADLAVIRQSSFIALNGTAADKNFKDYLLEWADFNSPSVWHSIRPPADQPVFNGDLGIWVPPYSGNFYVRLIVRDLAGNTSWSRQRVSWGTSTNISGLYKSEEIISPNSDGVKDAVAIHYTTNNPTHLLFNIYNENNTLLRSITADHAVPGSYHVIWDGRNASGGVVPDGNYHIEVSGYRLYVEVDTTPPQVGIAIDAINPVDISMSVSGYAFDPALSNWRVDYGYGENPDQWHQLEYGVDWLIGMNSDGNPQTSPPISTTIASLNEFRIPYYTGRRLRIVAEDRAGNKSSMMSGVMEETLQLLYWDDDHIVNQIPAARARAGQHRIQALETYVQPFASVTLQYRVGSIWHDAPVSFDSISGILEITWDNSAVANEFNAVRIKAVETTGAERFSAPWTTANIFALLGDCLTSPRARNELFEPLSLLTYQFKVQGSNEWIDYRFFASSEEQLPDDVLFATLIIPEGVFSLSLPYSYLLSDVDSYSVRMFGVGISGQQYLSNTLTLPPTCPAKPTLTLNVSYPEAECGEVSDKAIVSVAARGSDFSSNKLTIVLDHPAGGQVLGEYERSISASANLDTSTLQTGIHNVKAVLNYYDRILEANREVEGNIELVVDRTIPTAQIGYPGAGGVCPVPQGDIANRWLGIPVEGVALDDIGVAKYKVEYGMGNNPAYWMSATTLSDGKSKAIDGAGPISGHLGVWNSSNLVDGDYTLRLNVVDVAGNRSCRDVNVFVDAQVATNGPIFNRSLISPNGDGIADTVEGSFTFAEPAILDISLHPLVKDASGNSIPGDQQLSVLGSGVAVASGTYPLSWDGLDGSGQVMTDGDYAIVVNAVDSCGNAVMRWRRVTVDNTSPTSLISYPAGEPLGTIVEITGSALDAHFKQYILSAEQPGNPESLIKIRTLNRPIDSSILGVWNTTGLSGIWILTLSAEDLVGNVAETTVTIDLGTRQELIHSFVVAPDTVSPNFDGHADVAVVSYELAQAAQTVLEVLDSAGMIVDTVATPAETSGEQQVNWNCLDQAGNAFPNGRYKLRLSAVMPDNPAVTQVETLSVVIDNTPPSLSFDPDVGEYQASGNLDIRGHVNDDHLESYDLSLIKGTVVTVIDAGNQNQDDALLGRLTDLPEGIYELRFRANDRAENTSQLDRRFIVDLTRPVISFALADQQSLFGGNKPTAVLVGTVSDNNLESFEIRYGAGESPEAWTVLKSGTEDSPFSFSWPVGKESGVADGTYSVELHARDKAGHESLNRVQLVVDNTVPGLDLTSPDNDGYVRIGHEVVGSIVDAHLLNARLELAPGQCATAYQWSPLKVFPAVVSGGNLYSWEITPEDGAYCLRLAAEDQSGNVAEKKVGIVVDNQPPAAPVLIGQLIGEADIELSWQSSVAADLSGYQVLKNGIVQNAQLLADNSYTVFNASEGSYTFTVKAIDKAGNASQASNAVGIIIDHTPPRTQISSPLTGQRIGEVVDIKGAAYSADDFKSYRVLVKPKLAVNWEVLKESSLPVASGLLARWDLFGKTAGDYEIRLESEDVRGNVGTSQVAVTLDQTPPNTPNLLSATVSGSTVTVRWQANTDADLAGYLLYCNGFLANSGNVFVADSMNYRLSGTTYVDSARPDGTYQYFLVAVDTAGNMSMPSNVRSATVDIGAPRAWITKPNEGSRFDEGFFVRAETDGANDIATVMLQYKPANEVAWITLVQIRAGNPLETFFDPWQADLPYGDYQIRAVATDLGGKTDPSPTVKTVIFADLTGCVRQVVQKGCHGVGCQSGRDFQEFFLLVR